MQEQLKQMQQTLQQQQQMQQLQVMQEQMREMQEHMQQGWQCVASLQNQIKQHEEQQGRLQYKIDEVQSHHRNTRLELLGTRKADGSVTPARKPSAYAAFTKKHFADVKASAPKGTPHGTIMRMLSDKWKAEKERAALTEKN